MNKRKTASRVIAAVLTAAALGFVWYALGHPEASFPWSNTITFALYFLYLAATVLLWIAPFPKKN